MNQLPRHNCLVYGGPPSQLIPAIGTLMLERLIAGYRCLYVNSAPLVDALLSYLSGTGINVRRHSERGALMVSSDLTHLVHGKFEIEAMIEMLRQAALQSERDGFTGFWASGDMTWELGREKNFDKLLEYECKLEELFHEIPTLNGVCQYHLDTLPATSIQDALYAHRGIYLNETLAKVNPHYIPPSTLAKCRPDTCVSHLNQMLETIEQQPYAA